MLILALDSTAEVGSVALCRDKEPVACFTLKNGNTHSETLLPMVESLLAVTGTALDDIDLFACSAGPGSFTGVRIGVATVKGLTFGKHKTVLGVSALESMARNLLPATGLLAPVMNARRGQVYTALFRAEGDTLTRLTPDDAMAATDLEAKLLSLGEPFTLTGDGTEVALAAFREAKPLACPKLLSEQNAVGVALAALAAYEAGERGTDRTLSPIYLRLPQAERERLERLQQEQKGEH